MSATPVEMERAKKIGSEFVRVYYKVMRAFSSHLHVFYEDDSSVVVHEAQVKEASVALHANNPQNIRELFHWMYDGAEVTLFSCVPHASVSGSILLVVSGKLKRKSYDEARDFTQVLVLKRQTKGYYVKTDTMHVMSPSMSVEPDSTTEVPDQTPLTSENTSKSIQATSMATRHQPKDSCMDGTGKPVLFEENQNIGGVVPVEQSNDEKRTEETKDELQKEKANKSNDLDSKSVVSTAQFTPTTAISSSSCLLCEKGPTSSTICDGCCSQLTEAMPSTRVSSHGSRDSPYLCTDDHVEGGNCPKCDMFKPPELTSMFAARLPLGSTRVFVEQLFSQYGTLARRNPVKVFKGLTHCYASITFISEVEMRKALAADIRCDGMELVKEVWAPRGRGGRKSAKDMAHRPDSAPKLPL